MNSEDGTKVTQFPSQPKAFRERKRLAETLRRIAEHIDGYELVNPPTGFVIVLVSETGNEVLHVGVSRRTSMIEAGQAVINKIKSLQKRVEKQRGNKSE